MKTNVTFKNNLRQIASITGEKCMFEVFEFEQLKGGNDIESALVLSFLKDSNIRLRQAKITLNNGAVRLESGALSYLRGDIEIDTKIGGIVGLGKKIFSSKATGETAFKPRYAGTGEITLEPSFGHYALVELFDETIIVDDGVFYAAEDSVEVGAWMQKNLSSALMGNEGLFQTKISGTGIVLLELPVPEDEVIKYVLHEDTLKVDGNFAILRTSGVDFTVEKSAKSLIGSAASGEGFLNVFRGTGEVWLVPTEYIYKKLKTSGLSRINNPGGSSNTQV